MSRLRDMPAYPTPGEVFTTDANGRTGPQSLWGLHGATGLTKREAFAMAALQGLLASGPRDRNGVFLGSEEQAFALASCALADALCEALEREGK